MNTQNAFKQQYIRNFSIIAHIDHGKSTLADRLIYTYPIHMALKFNTPLLVYGENVSYEYGGGDSEETYSAREILSNGVASDIPLEELIDENLSKKDLELTIAPPPHCF